jgi:hypothetical protein
VEGQVSLTDFVLRYQSGLTVLGVMLLTHGIKRLLGAAADHPWAQRLILPSAPAVFATLLAFVPGWYLGALPERVTGGALLGLCAPFFYSVVKRRIDPAADAEAPPAGAAP